MSLRSYDEILTAIENWLHRVGEQQLIDRAPEFIELADDKINHELTIVPMEVSTDLTITAQTIDLPQDYRGVRRLYIPGQPNWRIQYMTPASFWGRWFSAEVGLPKFYTVEGAQGGAQSEYTISFGPYRTEDGNGDPQTVKLLYWKKFLFDTDNQTNWITKNAVGLYLYGGLIEASQYFDKPVTDTLKWAQNYDSLMATVKSSDRDQRVPADGAAMQPWGVSTA